MPTYTTTAKRALRWLQGGNLVSDIDAGFQALAEDVDAQFGSIGKSVTSATETRTNAAYGLLTTPDRVQSVVLPTDGLLAISFYALWKSSGGGEMRAAIFIGSNQIKIAKSTGVPVTQAGASIATTWAAVCSTSFGLVSDNGSSDSSSVTTGQVIGMTPIAGSNLRQEIDGTSRALPNDVTVGGPCYVFAAAGTYDISVQFKLSSGTVSVKERQLLVHAIPYA